MRINEIAAAIHRRMCEDDRFGYSWDERYGHTSERWEVGGKTFDIRVGDYDCSSSAITAWKKALTGTPYANALDAASYTGNMRSVFVNSGLFEVKPMSFIAQPGDLYLNDETHVAICQSQSPDMLSEFSINEKNGVHGGKRGDQTGHEAHVRAYYNFAKCILHYNGKADTASAPSAPNTPSAPAKKAKAPKVKFRIFTSEEGWLEPGKQPARGNWIKRIAIDFSGNGWYQVKTAKHGWLEPVSGYDITDDENGYAGYEDSEIIAVRCYYDTPEPTDTYFKAAYRVSDVKADWWPWQYDDEVDANQDGYAGNDMPIDRFEIKLTA